MRNSPLLYERDGDFNPGWLLFVVFSGAGLIGSAVACLVALRNDRAWPAAIAAMIFCATAMLITAIIVVPIARAKLLAPGVAAGMRAMGAAAGGDTPADYETLTDRGASE